MVTVRPFADEDFDAVLSIWNRALPLDAITPEIFLRRVLLDENREPEGLMVAVEGNRIIGFIYAVILRHPIEKVGLMEHRGFVPAFGIDPNYRGRGASRALLRAAEDFFLARKRSEITLCPYIPNYFVPGVDKEAYAKELAWLRVMGFEEYMEAIAMDAMIGKFQLSPQMVAKEESLAREGLLIRPLQRNQTIAFLAFMNIVMPGDWVEDARRLMQRIACGEAPPNSIYVALDRGEIVGYCKFDGEHFGPFGVAETHQSRGIGTILLARTLLQMRFEGYHAAYVLWTGERAAKGVYGRLGFTISRRFALMRKKIG